MDRKDLPRTLPIIPKFAQIIGAYHRVPRMLSKIIFFESQDLDIHVQLSDMG